MQQTDSTYNALLAAGALKEYQAIINDNYNRPYTQQHIVSAKTQAQMLDSNIGIGGTYVKKLNIVLTNLAGMPTIPRMAKITMQFRLSDGTTSSNWYPKGTFYIDTRHESYRGVLSIEAYDPMLKAEQPFAVEGTQGDWPKTDHLAIVGKIAARIGVEIDERTTPLLNKRFPIGYPGYGDDAYTCRDVLGFIGAMYAGNWVITDENKLRLIVLGDIPEDTNLLINEDGYYITIGGVRIIVNR